MFGTVARMKVKPGKFEEITALSEQWDRDTSSAPGHVAMYVYQLDGKDNEYIMAVIFTDRESYFANANRPETNEFYQQYRQLLEEDPEWNDGEIVYWSVPNASNASNAGQ